MAEPQLGTMAPIKSNALSTPVFELSFGFPIGENLAAVF